MTSTANATVAVFNSPESAGLAVLELRSTGFDLGKVSVAGKDLRPKDQVIGYYAVEDGIRYWGTLGDVWGNLWALLTGWAFFSIPGLGPVLVAGPLAQWLIRALENAPIFGGLGPVGAALHSVGLSRERIAAYESELAAGKYLLVVHGSASEISQARKRLKAFAY